MGMLSILHLSDLHWSEGKKGDMRIVIDGLIEDLCYLKRGDTRPDLVIFSGDLVHAGEDEQSFDHAYKELLERVLVTLNLPETRLFMVPGNHDMSRKAAREPQYVEAGLLASLQTADQINAFIDEMAAGKPTVTPALARAQNYRNFHLKRIGAKPISNNPLLQTYALEVRGIRAGIACFNTAWRATGEADDRDRKNMILGERNVDIALSDLQDCEFRVGVYHHPFEWLTTADEASVSSRLFSHFDLLMCGHIHQASPEARTTSAGSAIVSQCGCLYETRRYFNGYQILEVDTDSQQVHVSIRTWFDAPRRQFDAATNVMRDGKISLPYRLRAPIASHSEIERLLREVRPIIRENAASHINIADSDNIKLGAKEAFVCPPLTEGRHKEFADAAAQDLSERSAENPDADDDADENELSLEDVLRDHSNILFLGDREAGKTSLAHYISVLIAEGTSDAPRIPVLIDYRNFKSNLYGLKRAISSYLGPIKSGLNTEHALKEGRFAFLLDNYSGQEPSRKRDFVELVSRYPENRWLAFADRRFGGVDPDNPNNDLMPKGRVIQIGLLPRRSIRELTSRWSAQLETDSEETFALVMSQLKSGNLPRSGYIVTLLLWAMFQERRFERINEAVLLSNMLDHLLGKADFTKALLSTFDAVSKEITLQATSKYLRQKGGFSDKNDILEFLIGFFRQKGLKHSAADVLSGLIECGVLVEMEGRVGFKYRCFGEYFFAQLIQNDKSVQEEIFRSGNFIEYRRELELHAGLQRQNSDLIHALVVQLESRGGPEIEDALKRGFDRIADSRRVIEMSLKEISDIRKKRLTQRQVDDLVDATDRKLAKRKRASRTKGESDKKADPKAVQPAAAPDHDPAAEGAALPSVKHEPELPLTPGEFFSTVSLLGRVIRNSEFTDADDKRKALRVYLRSHMGAFIIYTDVLEEALKDVFSEQKIDVENDAAELEVLLYLFRKIFLTGMLSNASEDIGTEKLTNVYDDILGDATSGLFEKMTIIVTKFDLGSADWVRKWQSFISENRKREFILDVLAAKIWITVHRKYLGTQERERVEKIVDDVERALGKPKHTKGATLQTIRTIMDDTNKRLDRPKEI